VKDGPAQGECKKKKGFFLFKDLNKKKPFFLLFKS